MTLTPDEERELARLRASIERLDDVDPEEIDAREYRLIFKRMVELQDKLSVKETLGLDNQHAMNCGAYPGSDDQCTCALAERVALQTEQTMHAAWRKRAEEAETELATLRDSIAPKPLGSGRIHP